MSARILRLAACAVLGVGSIAVAEPPKVESAQPDNADIGVDRTVNEIRIRFDQDMSPRGRSVCGGGESFPKIVGEVAWPDARTIVIPVKLEPGKTYAMSINCPGAQNFRGVNGEACEAYPISFSTRRDEDAALAMTEEQAKAATVALRKAIDERYSYRDLRGVDWDKVFADNRARLDGARTPSEFARAAARTLAAAQDVHATVRVGGFLLATHRRAVRPNIDVRAMPKMLTDFRQCNQRVVTGMYEGVPYLLIGDWSGRQEEYAPAIEFIKQHKDVSAIIVDVRPNSGGDELLARAVAGHFVAARTVYSTNKSRDPSAKDGWSRVFERAVEPAPDSAQFGGRVIVLVGKACMSSNESFILMMKHGAKATLVGETTYGSSGNPRPVDLGSGVTAVLPTWIDMLPDGTVLEGRGIAPDVVVPWPGEAGADPVLAAAPRAAKAK